MPIAHIVLAPGQFQGKGDLIALWAKAAGLGPEHMTINILRSEQQWGAPYKVMANLFLPTLWSEQDVKALQEGLAQALAEFFALDSAQVHIITSLVASGQVVENGKTREW